MKLREFNKALNTCKNKKTGRLDLKRLIEMPEETRHDMLLFLVRKRAPVVKELVTPLLDWAWLRCMGYLYETDGKSGYTFLHTREHVVL